MKTRRLIGLASISIATAIFGTACSAAPAKALPRDVVVSTLNVHGAVDSTGDGNGGDPIPIIRDVKALIALRSPDVISLQELCERQYRPLKAELAKLGYSGTMTMAHKTNGCNDVTYGNDIGPSIFVKDTIANRQTWALPWDPATEGRGVQPRRLVCVTASTIKGRLCATHLTPAEPDRTDQAEKIKTIFTSQGWKYVTLAADFNMDVYKMQATFSMYNFAGGRIDHVLSTNVVELVAQDSVPSSGHPAVTTKVLNLRKDQ